MKIKAIIFDMDGTIIDTNNIWKIATTDLIKSQKSDIDDKALEALNASVHGLGLEKGCQIIKESLNCSASIADMSNQYTQIACDIYRKGIKFLEGFEEFYAKVKNKNLKTAIATNADLETLKIAKEILNLEKYFQEHIYSIDCVNNICKPDPAIYLHAALNLKVFPDQCIAIEDSAHGIAAAKAAGMYCIGINSNKNKNCLKQADYIVDNYSEIDLDKLLV